MELLHLDQHEETISHDIFSITIKVKTLFNTKITTFLCARKKIEVKSGYVYLTPFILKTGENVHYRLRGPIEAILSRKNKEY